MSHLILLFVFFFLMLRRPPRSTLFPYTTLFRSILLTLQADVAQNYFALRALDAEIATVSGTVGLRNEQVRLVRSRFEGDRKSTRLNSSHVEISYAVFCLKKKKNKKKHTRKLNKK